MNKSKLVLGITVIILGGSIMLVSMISGIFYFAGNSYEDVYTFDIEFQETRSVRKTSLFSVKEGQIFSIWFRYPNRKIENENLKIAVSLIDEDENILREFREDFQFGYFRNSNGNGQYYKLGDHNFRKNFRGYLQYAYRGSRPSMKTSELVLRKSLSGRLPLRQIGFFLLGIFVLIVGIGTIVKNSNNRKQLNTADPNLRSSGSG